MWVHIINSFFSLYPSFTTAAYVITIPRRVRICKHQVQTYVPSVLHKLYYIEPSHNHHHHQNHHGRHSFYLPSKMTFSATGSIISCKANNERHELEKLTTNSSTMWNYHHNKTSWRNIDSTHKYPLFLSFSQIYFTSCGKGGTKNHTHIQNIKHNINAKHTFMPHGIIPIIMWLP